MENLKSQTGIFTSFYESLLCSDMVRHYGDLSFSRDFKTLQSRVRNEGFSFLTKTLPLLAKALDLALVRGRFTCPSNFKKYRGTAYPCFLRGLLKRVLDADGSVKTDPCISAVRDVRQICYLLYKYEQLNNQRRNQQIEEFITVDNSLGWSLEEYSAGKEVSLAIPRVLKVANTLLRALLLGYDSDVIRPKHGPGAVASGEKNWEKMDFKILYECIHQRFPYYRFFFTNAMDLAASVKSYWALSRVPSGIAKLLTVPKDSRGERIRRAM